MNEAKDKQKTGVHSYGQSAVSMNESLQSKHTYEYAHKKTEKLVTALYMVTDCMEHDDALKSKLRLLGVELLSSIHRLALLSPVEKHATISGSLAHISEILSFVEIAHTIGFVSEMNAGIIKKEFKLLTTELHSYQVENESASYKGAVFENQKMSGFTLNESLFAVNEDAASIREIADQSVAQAGMIKDKNTYNLSVKNSHKNTFPSPTKRLQLSSGNQVSKHERVANILALIQDKKDISIKDISSAFTDCSEKTIQRELNDLVSKGQVKKIGAKRWSRYLVV